jgi:hypothetical protein
MIDVLLINPNEHAHELVRVLSTNNVSYLIVTTNGNMFAYPNDMNVLNMNQEPWVKSEQFKIGLAWGVTGYKFLKGVTKLEQILFSNSFSDNIIDSYQTTPFRETDGKLYNVMSFKGVHAVIDSFAFVENKWVTLKDHSSKFYIDGVNAVYKFLDENGILNGPSQLFINPNGVVTVRLGYSALGSKVSQRNTGAGIVAVAKSESTFKTNFFNWVADTGSSPASFNLS